MVSPSIKYLSFVAFGFKLGRRCFYVFNNIYLINVCGWDSQLCPTLCDSMDYSLPGSSVHGISQAKVLEWVAISFSRGSCYPGIEPWSLTSSVLAGGFFITESPEKPQWCCVLRTKFCLVLCFNTVYPGCSLLPSLTTLKTTGSQGNVQG